MTPELQLKPLANSYYHIQMAFKNGTPLSSSELNFLYRYYSKISNPNVDAICKYYKIFAKPARLTLRSIRELQKKILESLEKEVPFYQIRISPTQLIQFKTLLMNELIFFHGNHTLTGAPFFPGGVPHVDFFQWGNLFGIVEYEEVLGENDTNILLYFERKQDLTLQQFVNSYKRLQPSPLILQPKLIRPIPKEEEVDHLRFSWQPRLMK